MHKVKRGCRLHRFKFIFWPLPRPCLRSSVAMRRLKCLQRTSQRLAPVLQLLILVGQLFGCTNTFAQGTSLPLNLWWLRWQAVLAEIGEAAELHVSRPLCLIPPTMFIPSTMGAIQQRAPDCGSRRCTMHRVRCLPPNADRSLLHGNTSIG